MNCAEAAVGTAVRQTRIAATLVETLRAALLGAGHGSCGTGGTGATVIAKLGLSRKIGKASLASEARVALGYWVRMTNSKNYDAGTHDR